METLLETLRLLSKEEIQQLDKFVQSPLNYYANNASGVLALFDFVKKYAPNFEHEELLNKELIASQLEKNNIDKIITGLHKVVQKYINWVYLEESSDEFYQHLGLLDFYLQKRPFDKFEPQFKIIEDYLLSEKMQKKNDTFFKLFLINYRKSDWMQTYKPSLDNNLQQAWTYFNIYALIQKAQIIFNIKMRNENAVFKFDGYHAFMAELKAFCAYNKKIPEILDLYYEAIIILESLDEEVSPQNGHPHQNSQEVNPEVFQVLLLKNKLNLPNPDYLNLASVERTLFLKLSFTNIQLTRKVFEIYKRHLEEHILSIEQLKPNHFSNIVRYACRSGELDWANNFLLQCKTRFSQGNDLEVYQLYSAYYHLFREDYSVASECFPTKVSIPLRKVEARCIQLMIFYPIQFQDWDNFIASFTMLVKRTELKPKFEAAFKNFAKSFFELIKLTPQHQLGTLHRDDPKKYHLKIDEAIKKIKNNPTAEAIWLITQLEKLKKK